MTRYAFLIGIAMSLAVAHAQTPDSIAAHRYVPLDVGNEWHYEDWQAVDIGPIQLIAYLMISVVNISSIEGEACSEVQLRRVSPSGTELSFTTEFVRFDPDVENVVNCVEGWSWMEHYYASPCPLSAPFDSLIQCEPGGYFDEVEVSGGWGTVSIGHDQIEATRKVWVPWSRESSFLHASDIGFVEYGFWEDYLWIRYARVGDVALGSPAPVSSEAPPDGAPPLALGVYPNPALASATATLTLEGPKTVTLEVSDLLGRVVRRREPGVLPAGEHLVALDVAGLPAGVYLVRLYGEGERFVSTVRLTVL